MCRIASTCDIRFSSGSTLLSSPSETVIGSAGSVPRNASTAARWMSGHFSGATSCFFGYVGTTSTCASGETCIASAGFSRVTNPRGVFPDRIPRTHTGAPGASDRSTSTGTYSHSFISNVCETARGTGSPPVAAAPPADASPSSKNTSTSSVAGVLCPQPLRDGGAFRKLPTVPTTSTAVPFCISGRYRANSWYFRG